MKIAILTYFYDLNPGYSLVGIVGDQIRMLTAYGHDVTVFTREQFDYEKFPNPDYKRATMKSVLPFMHLKDYDSATNITPEHVEIIKQTTQVMVDELRDMDVIFTHDFVFTGWNLPLCIAAMNACKAFPQVPWLHWIHSIPTAGRDWWTAGSWPTNHRIVYPNETDRVIVAEAYHTDSDRVRTIPHIKDLRSFFDFSDVSCELIRQFPMLMQADIVQVYPAAADRQSAKNVPAVIEIFSYFKRHDYRVCLFIANQWATTTQRREELDEIKARAKELGMVLGSDLIFLSDCLDGQYTTGLPKHVLRELLMLTNVFIYPTTHETFGLVLPEVLLASGCMVVLNRSLDMQREISGNNGLFFDFGSFLRRIERDNQSAWLYAVAETILGRWLQEDGIQAKTFARQQYNWNNLYRKFYAPILAESVLW